MGVKSLEDNDSLNEMKEAAFDDGEHEWLNALGMDDDDDDEDEDYEEEESTMMVDNDQEFDGPNDDVKDGEGESEEIEEDRTLSDAIRDYLEDPKQLFTITELIDLKNKKRTLIERRQNGYYRDKNKYKKAYEQIVEVYAPYITRENLLMLHHPWSTQK